MIKFFKSLFKKFIFLFSQKRKEQQFIKKSSRKLTKVIVERAKEKNKTKQQVARYLIDKNKKKRLSPHQCQELAKRKFMHQPYKITIGKNYILKLSNA